MWDVETRVRFFISKQYISSKLETYFRLDCKAKSNTFDDILNSFDELCKPVDRTLELVPVIPDRLLKNMKNEGTVNAWGIFSIKGYV